MRTLLYTIVMLKMHINNNNNNNLFILSAKIYNNL